MSSYIVDQKTGNLVTQLWSFNTRTASSNEVVTPDGQGIHSGRIDCNVDFESMDIVVRTFYVLMSGDAQEHHSQDFKQLMQNTLSVKQKDIQKGQDGKYHFTFDIAGDSLNQGVREIGMIYVPKNGWEVVKHQGEEYSLNGSETVVTFDIDPSTRDDVELILVTEGNQVCHTVFRRDIPRVNPHLDTQSARVFDTLFTLTNTSASELKITKPHHEQPLNLREAWWRYAK